MTIPDWLAPHLNVTCPYCGALITNNAQLTDRYCSNPNCPEHMAHKIDVLAKRFGIRNFGVAAARQTIRSHKLKYHTQVLPYWFDERPLLPLYEIGEISLIKGHQRKWREYCEGCDTMREVLQKPTTPADVKANAWLLYTTEMFCRVKPRMLGRRINVMLSGSFEGYRSRSDFIADMNRQYGEIVQLVDVGKRKTGVAYLIKEAYATDHEKSAIAQAAGIRIVTPKELSRMLHTYCTNIKEAQVNGSSD